MISAGEFKNGVTLEIDGTVYQIVEFQHVKPGKGAAFVRTKLKDVIYIILWILRATNRSASIRTLSAMP